MKTITLIPTSTDNLHDATDTDLVSLFHLGLDIAAAVLYNRHFATARKAVFFLIHDYNAASVIAQQAFISTLISIREGDFPESAQFKFCLIRSARNLALDNLKSAFEAV